MKNLRKYGKEPFSVVVIHGGPGASGEMAPVAKELSHDSGILEPLQTDTTIEGQIQELKTVLDKYGHRPVTLLGHSWGAWLSFIFAAQYPMWVKKLILIGSGPFEEKYASTIMETRFSRLNEEERRKVHALQNALLDPCTKDKHQLLAQFGKMMAKADFFDPLPSANEEIEIRQDVFQSVWKEASEWRQSGKLLELGKRIKCPIVAIHGDYDPHPYQGVAKPLSQMIKDFRLVLMKNCGHKPWMERNSKNEFYEALQKELMR